MQLKIYLTLVRLITVEMSIPTKSHGNRFSDVPVHTDYLNHKIHVVVFFFMIGRLNLNIFVSKTHLTSENRPILRMGLCLSEARSTENKSFRDIFTNEFIHGFLCVSFCNSVNRYKRRNSLNRHAQTPMKDNP